MGLKLKNDAVSRLASGISSSDTSITLLPGTGLLFPTLSSGDYFPATLIKVDGSREIVKVTARSTDVLTVVRAQEGTVAQTFNANDRIELRLTAETFTAQLFQKGTKLLFPQETAPTGWTQVTDDSADNRMLRVVNTLGGGIGGTHSPILNNVVPAHTHSFTTGNESQGHTHSGSTSGDGVHSHSIYDPGHSHGGVPERLVDIDRGSGGPSLFSIDGYGDTNSANTNISVQSAGAHFHTFTTGGVSQSHTHSGTTDNGSSSTNWQPRYINMILCTKD